MITEQAREVLQQIDTGMQDFFQDRVAEAVEAADIAYDICQKAREVDLTDNLTPDFINQWVSFYDAPDTFMRNAFEFLAPETSPEELELIGKAHNKEALQECVQTSVMGMISGEKVHVLEDLKEELFDGEEDGNMPDTLPDGSFEKFKTEPMMLFYFKVWFPCWIEYCEFLPAIMRKAVKGDSDALEKLIRLDPCILNHPQINIEYQKIRLNNKPLFDRLCKAQQGKGLKELTPTNVKYLFGAYVYRLLQKMDSQMQIFTDQYGYRFSKVAMSAEQILALFNQRAKKTRNTLREFDFESVSAFKAGISRYKSFWDNSFR